MTTQSNHTHGLRLPLWTACALLSGILGLQVVVVLQNAKTPLRMGDLMDERSKAAQLELLRQAPILWVGGGSIRSDVSGTIDVGNW